MRYAPTSGTLPLVTRVSPDLKERVSWAAEMYGETVSAFTRRALEEAIERCVEPVDVQVRWLVPTTARHE